MNEEIRDKWAAKLESGEYEQAKGSLRDGDAYCCLGVLCEVFREVTGEGKWVKIGGGYVFEVGWSANDVHLPSPVHEWAGFETSNPAIREGGGRGNSASHLNDNGYDFRQIAALIRELPATPRVEKV